jgi:enoyl-CoA hydratase/carnithine racemase
MPVSYEKRDHIGIVTLSRPSARNAWGTDFNEGVELTEDRAEGHWAWREKRKPVFRGR